MRVAAALALATLVAGCAAPASTYTGGTPGLPAARLEELLTNRTADRLALTSFYIEGRAPSQRAMEAVAARLKDLTGKREVTVLPPVHLALANASRDHGWTAAEAQGVAARLPALAQPGTAVLVYLYLDGYGASHGRVSGFGADSITIFPDTFRLYSHADGSLERAVLLHETGHALGLVNHGLPMVRDHVDRSEPCLCHSSNPESVMAHPDDSAHPLGFDNDDLADVRAFQGAHR
jgi:hypothetical protein